MKTITLFAAVLLASAAPGAAQVPQLLNHQGRILVNKVNFNGTGGFKFAIVRLGGSVTLWSNDNTSVAGSEPAHGVPLSVLNGLYALALGDTALPNMQAVPPALFAGSAGTALRIWFSDGVNGFQQLTPDQPFTTVPYAATAENVPDGAITSGKIAGGAIGTPQLAPGAVTSNNMSPGAVGPAQLAPLAVTSAALAEGAVGTPQLAPGAVTGLKIASGAVGNIHIAAGSITNAKLTAGAVNTPQLADASVTAPKLAPGAVGTAQLAPGAVTTVQLAPGAVGAAQLANGAVGSNQIATGAVQAMHIASGSIGQFQLAKPARSGTILSSSLDVFFNQASFAIPFVPAFATVPNLTLSVETPDSLLGLSSTLYVKSKSVNSATGLWQAAPPEPVLVENFAHYPRTSLTIVNGRPALSCLGGSDGANQLRFIRASDANGSAWPPPVTIDTEGEIRFHSLAIVNGNPAIAYTCHTSQTLRFVRALDAAGTIWGVPVNAEVSVDATTCSLAVINGTPAIAYRGATGGSVSLRYVQSFDANGSAWATPHVIDATGSTGNGCSLVEVNQRAAISYTRSDTRELKYVSAADAFTPPLSWNTPKALDQVADAIKETTAMKLVNGNPAIAYADYSATGLKFIRAADPDGLSWNAPVSPDAPGDQPYSASLAIINGRPVISFHDGERGVLRIVRAADASGAAWDPPVTAAAHALTGLEPSLAEVNGAPAVSYFHYGIAEGSGISYRFLRQPVVSFKISWIAIEP